MTILIVLVLIIIFYIAFTWNVPTYEKYLYGFWVAEGDEFCEEADIQSMLVFVGTSANSWLGSTTRNCYIIIMDDLANQGFTMKYRSGWSGTGIGKYSVRAEVKFDEDQLWTEGEDSDDATCNVVMTIDVIAGTLKIRGTGKNSKIVYAKLHKQHDTTNMASLLEDEEVVEDE